MSVREPVNRKTLGPAFPSTVSYAIDYYSGYVTFLKRKTFNFSIGNFFFDFLNRCLSFEVKLDNPS